MILGAVLTGCATAGLTLPRALAASWALGTLAVALWCAAGHLALRRLAAGARPLEGAEWPGLLAASATLAGVRRPLRLLTAFPRPAGPCPKD